MNSKPMCSRWSRSMEMATSWSSPKLWSYKANI